jgi:hypothetical protein
MTNNLLTGRCVDPAKVADEAISRASYNGVQISDPHRLRNAIMCEIMTALGQEDSARITFDFTATDLAA